MNFDDQLKRAVDTLGDRLRDDISRELRLITDDLSASAKADRDAAAADAAQAAEAAAPTAADPAAAERLVDAVRAIDGARSLSEILDALTGSAGREAARAGVLLLRGDRLRGWRFVGFPASFDESTLDLSLGDAGIIAEAVEHKFATSTSASGRPAPPFAELPDGVIAMAIPIALAGDVVAVLYADQGNPEPGTLNPGLATLEVLGRHAARSLEALTAFKAARSITRADTGAQSGADGGTPGLTADDEADEAARRYARLLISEIKLYHEDAIVLGRRDRDLATRLGGEIARARALYEQRIPPHLRDAAEHFHAELVRTLGGGDASLFAKASAS